MTEGYSEHRVQVGPAEWETFTGREIAHVLGNVEHPSGYNFTLYETPNEGLQLYVEKWEWAVQKADPTIRLPGEEANTQRLVGGGLLTEEEARQRHPQILEALLERKERPQDKEELGP